MDLRLSNWLKATADWMNPEGSASLPSELVGLRYLNEICDNCSSLLAAIVGLKLRRSETRV